MMIKNLQTYQHSQTGDAVNQINRIGENGQLKIPLQSIQFFSIDFLIAIVTQK